MLGLKFTIGRLKSGIACSVESTDVGGARDIWPETPFYDKLKSQNE